jgi:hypothetical protein
MRDLMNRCRPIQVGARAGDFVLRVLDRRLVLLQLVLQLRKLEE